MTEILKAKRKDGLPAQVGDRVLLKLNNGEKIWGSLESVEGVRFFPSLGFARMQTYRILCSDGLLRPAVPRHILYAAPSKYPRRRAA